MEERIARTGEVMVKVERKEHFPDLEAIVKMVLHQNQDIRTSFTVEGFTYDMYAYSKPIYQSNKGCVMIQIGYKRREPLPVEVYNE